MVSVTQLHWLPCKNQFYPTSQMQLGPPPICNIGFLTFHHLDLRPEAFSYFLPRISNNICDFATGEGNDRPRSSLVFATRSTFVFLASFLHTNFSLHSIASETLNQFRLSTQSNVEGFNCCRYTKLSDDCAFNAWQKTTSHGKKED